MANSDWYYTQDGRTKLGPFSLTAMHQLARSGQLLPSHMVRRGDTTKWATAASQPDLFPPCQRRPFTPPGNQAVSAELSHHQGDRCAPSVKRTEVPLKPLTSATAPLKRRLIIGVATSVVGLASAGVFLIFIASVVWYSASKAAAPKTADALALSSTKAEDKQTPASQEEGPQRPRQPLKVLFVRLAPAVPIVEAVEAGSGSGFLIKHDGKYLVVTNRHVIENARQGVVVHFLLGDEPGDEKRFTIPASKTTIVGIHRTADLAVLDVSSAAAEIEGLHIEPVRLAPSGHKAQVGEHVFAIGHPGGGNRVLTRTLSDGIVSAVGRQYEESRFLQVTVPLNPGNSGGPLFDDDGQVLGVNSFIIRKSSGREIALEALNFALESEFIHELLTDKAKSLDREAIAAMTKPGQPDRPQTLTEALERTVRRYTGDGYRPLKGTAAQSRMVFRLEAGRRRVFTMNCETGTVYGLAAVNQGAADIDLALVDSEGKVIASDVRDNPDPEVNFRVPSSGEYSVIVMTLRTLMRLWS